MKGFFQRQRGSITVLVTLILVPSVFFTGFMVDLSRLKLYGNQAVMTADNYGEAILSEYDNLLKELYGLFAVTQDKEGLAQLDNLQKYMKTSFNPTENTISWQHLQSVQDKLNVGALEGFMPYKNAKVTLDKEYVANADLGTKEILSTQIGDFMKFRIAQGLIDDGSSLIDTLEQIENTQNDAKAIDKKTQLDKVVGELYELAKEYYEALKPITGYPEYIEEINETYADCMETMDELMEAYHTAIADEEADEDAIKNIVSQKLSEAIEDVQISIEGTAINFTKFETYLADLKQCAGKITSKGSDIQTLKGQLEEILSAEKISNDLKQGIQEDLNEINALFDEAALYKELADAMDAQNRPQNEAYRRQAGEILAYLGNRKAACLTDGFYEGEAAEKLAAASWKAFTKEAPYYSLYQSLEQCFEAGGEGQNGKQKKEAAENLTKDAENELNTSETTAARNIPSSFGYGKPQREVTKLSDMIHDAANMFSFNGLRNEASKLLLKVYMVEYDYGMFTSRTTNVGSDAGTQKEASLLGYEFGSSINYLYQAELEYLLGGSNDSTENLNSARNKILAVRMVSNFTATYSVKEVNRAIRYISNTVKKINPILGAAVGAALRSAVASAETAADWKALKEGEAVVLAKSELQQLTSYDMIAGLLGMDGNSQSSGDRQGIKLDYEQYLKIMTIMLTSSDTLTQRTANLIELNVNTVQQKVGASGTLSEKKFKMSEAHTAVNATCTVHLDFVVMPKGFAKQVTDSGTYGEITEFEKNSYKFTVTRGY